MATRSARDAVFNQLSKVCPPATPDDKPVKHLSDFLAVMNWFLKDGQLGWFRGQSNAKWPLTPGALRHRSHQKRRVSLELLSEFRRCVEPRIGEVKARTNDEVRLHWLQLAQHYGMPTRMLDWTTNAAVGLYFACSNYQCDGAFFILDPINLNSTSGRPSRVLNAVSDMAIIGEYLNLGSELEKPGVATIAIQPTWNNDRVTLQHGCFTLHGSRTFGLDIKQSPGLSYIPIRREHKKQLQNELGRIGIGEMFIFPEPEHVCNHLKRAHGLE